MQLARQACTVQTFTTAGPSYREDKMITEPALSDDDQLRLQRHRNG
jgi:hypothetical protein